MKTLLVDTSGDYSIALVAEEDTLLALASTRQRQLACLHSQIRSLLDQLGIEPAALERIAVITGPGSWTGLNIGVTAAKTLAQVLQVPLVGISTLNALALAQPWVAGPVCTLIDARRGRAYSALYETDGSGRADPESAHPQVLSLETLISRLERLPDRPLVVEYGAAHKEVLRQALDEACVRAVAFLEPRGLLGALGAARKDLSAREAMAIFPSYMQQLVPGRQEGQSSC